MIGVILGIIFFMSFFAYFAYVFLRFFTSPINIAQLPLYIFGFLWGSFSGTFFGLRPDQTKNMWGLFTHDGPAGTYFVGNVSGVSSIFDFIVDFTFIFILCHLHGLMITPIAILATIEFVFMIIFARQVL